MSEPFEQITQIQISDILDKLEVKYKISGDCLCLFENGVTSGWKASIKLNMISDFSGKGRAQGGPRQFVKLHLGLSKKETFDWFVKNFNIKSKECNSSKKYGKKCEVRTKKYQYSPDR